MWCKSHFSFVRVCVDAGCCSIHYQNLKRREAIQQIAGNPNYDADLERLRILKFSRDDYRSVALFVHSSIYVMSYRVKVRLSANGGMSIDQCGGVIALFVVCCAVAVT